MSSVLQTERLLLRPYQTQDAARIATLLGDIDVARWLTRVPHPYRVEDAEGFIAKAAPSDSSCAITHEGALIGGISITEELGYWLSKSAWGNGFATEAAQAFATRYFANTDFDLKSGYILGNDGSQNVLRKLGFQEADIQEVASAALNVPVQVCKMRLTKTNWEARS